MIVQKVLNNSLVLSMDDDSREVIVMGKGIGFNSRPGDEIAPEKIEKLFVTQALGARSGYLEALSAIPDEVIEMAAMIISRRQYAACQQGSRADFLDPRRPPDLRH